MYRLQIRAASLSGDCAYKQEVQRGHYAIRGQHQVRPPPPAPLSLQHPLAPFWAPRLHLWSIGRTLGHSGRHIVLHGVVRGVKCPAYTSVPRMATAELCLLFWAGRHAASMRRCISSQDLSLQAPHTNVALCQADAH